MEGEHGENGQGEYEFAKKNGYGDENSNKEGEKWIRQMPFLPSELMDFINARNVKDKKTEKYIQKWGSYMVSEVLEDYRL